MSVSIYEYMYECEYVNTRVSKRTKYIILPESVTASTVGSVDGTQKLKRHTMMMRTMKHAHIHTTTHVRTPCRSLVIYAVSYNVLLAATPPSDPDTCTTASHNIVFSDKLHTHLILCRD